MQYKMNDQSRSSICNMIDHYLDMEALNIREYVQEIERRKWSGRGGVEDRDKM